MRDRWLLTTAALLAVLPSIARSQTATPVPAPSEAAQTVADCRPVESERFIFHSDPWINLHHFLYQWARNVPERQSGDRRRAVKLTAQDLREPLEGPEREAWDRALDYYREQLVAADLLFDRRLTAVRDQLAMRACKGVGPDDLDAKFGAVLEGAMAVYRSRWWPWHHDANMAWILEQAKALKVHESTLAERLASAYGGKWPAERIRVDAAAYANWAGAYTTNSPDHLTISSTAFKGLEGLEILFHEVSHASFFEQRMLGRVAAAFRAHGAEPPNRLLHTIQFITPAELVRSQLGGEELDRFQSVGERVLQRGSLREQFRIVRELWKPYLDGQVGRDEALDRIARELAKTSR